ncbi:MAG: DUF3866 family protein [Armatimonadetes bacterium]|nr:DUF3866 family protein [Armatimonadota bacterium]
MAFADAPEESEPALAYPAITGPVAPGDRVLVNTTAVRLGLGTGGLHFIMAVDRPSPGADGEPGAHLVKLRYTPAQHTVAVVEESPLAEQMEAAPGLEGMPVVAAELHSQVAAIAAGARAAAPAARIAYIMPDAAALPLGLSRLVPRLKETGLIDRTITCGQAFGGDLEAVSLPSALQAAHALGAGVAIVAQGPGNAGTGTRLGYSGIAQADWLNAAHALGGIPIAALRLSFADPRPRHQGISHHTLTVLGTFCLCRAVVPLPALPAGQMARVGSQLAPLRERHLLEAHEGAPALALLERLGVNVTTMGRSMAVERAFFLAAGAAGAAAAGRLADRVPG